MPNLFEAFMFFVWFRFFCARDLLFSSFRIKETGYLCFGPSHAEFPLETSTHCVGHWRHLCHSGWFCESVLRGQGILFLCQCVLGTYYARKGDEKSWHCYWNHCCSSRSDPVSICETQELLWRIRHELVWLFAYWCGKRCSKQHLCCHLS